MIREEIQFANRLQFDIDDMKKKFESIGEIFLKQIRDSHRWRDDLMEAVRQNTWQSQRSYDIGRSLTFEAEQEQELSGRLLNRLRYSHMEDRHDKISEAYERTFEWIHHEPETGSRPWASFTNWLYKEQSLYWVTGKPGSGKSTLMKYLYHDSHTLDHLRSWSSPLPLMTAAFFFWNSGSKMQMSQLGLLQSLLYDTLRQDQTLIPRVFPDRWEVYRLFGDDPCPFSWSELVKALKLITKEDCVTARFCFFIDGLDEFEGDHTELIKLLMDIVTTSSVKICVASRPWPIFEKAFKSRPSLMLQDLTALDIQLFVNNKFHEDAVFRELEEEDPKYAAKLLNEITTKSSGVFLWVHLVVQSLLTGLTNGDRISDLERRLHELPPDLEELFQKMLDHLDPFYREHASQLFQVHRAAHSPPTLLEFAFADEDTEFVFRAEVKPLTDSEKRLRCKRMKRRLISRCKGLLEIAPNKSAGPNPLINTADQEANSKVEYLHRTVKDFFGDDTVWRGVVEMTKDPFDPYLHLCRSAILLLKTIAPTSLTDTVLWNLVASCIEYATQSEERTGKMQADLLDELDQAASQISAVPGTEISTLLQKFSNSKPIGNPHWTHTRFSWTHPTPFLNLAAMCGLSRYLDAKLNQEYSQLCSDDTETTPLLYSAACCGSFICSEGRTFCSRESPQVEMIRCLLEKGADPNQLYRGLTPWRTIVQAARRDARNGTHKQAWLEIIDMFMKHGAYPPVDRTSLDWAVPPASCMDGFRNHSKMTVQKCPSYCSCAEDSTHIQLVTSVQGTGLWSKLGKWKKIFQSSNQSQAPKKQAEKYSRPRLASQSDSSNLSNVAVYGSADELSVLNNSIGDSRRKNSSGTPEIELESVWSQSSDNAIGGILAQGAVRSKIRSQADPDLPLAPDITSVENTGYFSDDSESKDEGAGEF